MCLGKILLDAFESENFTDFLNPRFIRQNRGAFALNVDERHHHSITHHAQQNRLNEKNW